MALRIRRGSDADRQLINPAQGELIYTTDTKKLYIGDGSTSGATAHGVLVGPADSSQTDLINDTSPQLGGNLDLNGFNITGNGNININGTIEATGNINLGSGAEDNVIVGGQIASSLIPDANNTYSLGAGNIRWADLHIGDVFASGTVETNNLVVTDYIWKGDDSSLLYNADNDTLSATNIEGNLIGNIYDEESGVILDAINRNINIDNINVSESVNTKLISSIDDINITAPTVLVIGPNGNGQLNVTNTDPFAGTLELDTFTDDASGFGGFVALGRGRGTAGARQQVQNGDNLYNLLFLGHRAGGSDIAASISVNANGTVSSGIVPGEMQFLTADDAGNLTNKLSILPNGRVDLLEHMTVSIVDVANGDTIDVGKTTHYFTTAGAEGANLPDGADGQILYLIAKDVSAGNMVINVAGAGWTPGAGTITFTNTGEGCTLQWIDAAWFCVGNNGALFA